MRTAEALPAEAPPAGTRGDRPRVVARLLMALVTAYRWIPKSAMTRCRFYPSCSAFALEALERHGACRGGLLVLRRLARCHPFNPGGIDRVPRVVGIRSGPHGGREGASA